MEKYDGLRWERSQNCIPVVTEMHKICIRIKTTVVIARVNSVDFIMYFFAFVSYQMFTIITLL